MRDYARVSGQFWIGETGKQFRSSRDAQSIALYLITCPSSNMLGLYYLPLPTLCHELGITKEGASKALRRISEAHFAYYDTASEHVWVPEMAKWQIGATLDAKDKRVTGIKRELESLRKSPFFNDFLERYRDAFHLYGVSQQPSPIEAPCKPHRSQEQEQEQDRERTPFKKRLSLESFTLTDDFKVWCREHGIPLQVAEAELPKFKDYYRGSGKPVVDAAARFRNWLRKGLEFDSKNGSSAPASRPQLQEMPL